MINKMKTLIQKTIWLLFIAIAITSCSKDEDNCNPDDEESPCYAGVKPGEKLLLIEEKNNGKTELKFEYNNRNQVVVRHVHDREGNITVENFTYNGEKLTKIERKSNGQLVMSEEYTYGNGNKPATGALKDEKGELMTHITYSYSSKSITEKSFNKDGEHVITSTYTFDDKGNPLIWQITAANNSMTSTQTLGDYDDKPYRYTGYPWNWKLSSVNNARSYSQTTSGIGGSTAITQHREVTYNRAGYPIKEEVYDKTSNTLIETRTYTYEQAN